MKKAIELLEKERKKHKISLSEIADVTKISLTTLKAMEDQNLRLLPPEPYLRGFVRSYARCLNMDEKEVLTIFDEEMVATKPGSKKEIEPDAKGMYLSYIYKSIFKYMLSNNVFKVLSALAILVLVLTVVFAVWMFNRYSKESRVDITPNNTSFLTTDATIDRVINETIDNEGSSTTFISTTTESIPAQNNTVRRVELIALGALQVRYTVDNSKAMTSDLQTGESILVSGTNVEIYTDDASSTSIVIDGNKLPISGNKGEAFVFKIP